MKQHKKLYYYWWNHTPLSLQLHVDNAPHSSPIAVDRPRPSLLPPSLQVDMDLFLWFCDEAKHLCDLLTFHGGYLEARQKDRGRDGYLKVGEQVARALATTRDTKRTELQRATGVGSVRSKTIRVPPVRLVNQVGVTHFQRHVFREIIQYYCTMCGAHFCNSMPSSYTVDRDIFTRKIFCVV